MKLLLTLGWRNIWRNPLRSLVLIGTIATGVWAGIMTTGFTNGFLDQRLTNLIENQLTHAQIHHPEFSNERDPEMYIQNHDEILTFLEEDKRVQSATPRTITDGMIQSPVTTAGVQVRGIHPERERQTTQFHTHLVEGDSLAADRRQPILLGKALAEKLNLKIGQRAVLTFQDVNDELTSGAFTVTGLFRTSSANFDERNVFVRSEDVSQLLAGKLIVHEIAMMLRDQQLAAEVVEDLNQQFTGIKAETWKDLSPELRYLTGFGDTISFYIMLVVMLALTFGILNTMLMAIFERTRELGMLMAVGMGKLRVFVMILIESFMISVSGGLAGLTAGALSILYLGNAGLNLEAFGEGLAEFGYGTVVYPSVNPESYLTITLMLMVIAMVSSIWPAVRALRVDPASIVRE